MKERSTSKEQFEIACVHELVEAQAARTPNAIAARFDGEALTYRELNERANSLARTLAALSAGPETIVGVCLDRSLALVVALLATLKAGAAYLPLDPEYPPDRLAFMLDDSNAMAVVTRTDLQHLVARPRMPTVLTDQDPQLPPRRPRPAGPGNLAYVIYTSGSTGRPKGVALEHRALVNLIRWQIGDDGLGDHPVATLQFSAIGFDAMFQEIFGTWATGGTVILIHEHERRDPLALWKRIAAERVQRLFIPFTPLQDLASELEPKLIEHLVLSEVVTAGEQPELTPTMVHLFEALPEAILANFYGPSETHVVTSCILDGPRDSWPLLPPIGCAISNVQLYLLDEKLRDVGVGRPGEIYIGGTALARGYLGQPSVTAERFLPDPFSTQPGARLYRTGDLGRLLHNGEVQFLGRIDDQVKIRGVRVELGEVQARLNCHPSVQESVLVARKDGGLDRLVAYFVTSDEAPSTSELRRFLATALPEVMLPAKFVQVPALPRTPSGKVDRLALPHPDRARPNLSAHFVSPRTKAERTVAAVWQEILEVEPVGIHDDFLELGGDSIRATRVAARLRKELGVDTPVDLILRLRTVSRLCGVVENGTEVSAKSSLRPLTTHERRARLAAVQRAENP